MTRERLLYWIFSFAWSNVADILECAGEEEEVAPTDAEIDAAQRAVEALYREITGKEFI